MSITGILSILPSVNAAALPSFDRLYQRVGQNTGNLLFTNAVWNQIDGPKERFNFTFDPEKLNERVEALVIPAANWLSPHVDFSDLADLVERLTIPVVLIGLGAQNHDFTGHVPIPEGTVRFIRAVADRSASISVRGDYTRKILKKLGITNVTVTGCPSLYHDFRRFERPPAPLRIRIERGLVHSTRYAASYAPFAQTDSVHRQLFRFAYAEGLDLLIQSEPEEMALLTGYSGPDDIDGRLRNLLIEIYQAESWDALLDYWRARVRLYFDVDSWARSLDAYDYVIGTRLHGTIMALNSGVPGVLIHHDSRTREMVEFAAIPSVDARGFQVTPARIRSRIERADYAAYYTRREANKATYRAFLERNSLPHTVRAGPPGTEAL